MSNEAATVRVSLAERSYDIQIGEGLLDQAVEFVTSRGGARHVVVITDANVDELYGDALADRFVDAGVESHVLVVEAGEPSKSTDVVADLWQTMLDEGCDRQTVVIAVGGGVVGDIAGFVAATFARGLRFFQVPTTLLAQVDSSVGGKTGVNLEGAKNMVGAFWQPDGVLIDTAVLKTLPEEEFCAGLAEVVKYGVILDAEFFAYLEANADAIMDRDPAALRTIIQRSCRLKADVVEADEREETGLRAKLNYGHTFGHALEAATGYSELLHGEAVAIGMACASRLAQSMGRIDAEATDRQVKLLERFELPTAIPEGIDLGELSALMWRDKKVKDGEVRFVLPTRIGEVETVASPGDDLVLASMRTS
ncbi:3-dehydroquinate synthase [Botrimarina mediterranea]|uniref:3-dehydroquinate synthase n=1 Tax=Botrimarina mediterranea TaxID=2528022 RepID=A0A518KEH0_9BACT|nr:3-dehydroquinate synthase [Botrimarina mediterranea]QDV76173.1 3-dehydroquinate synthase [Botrimarina mediterranea]QDV80770.1 3-dehydroquinate synthase [Planctomycetes bacterium K2D]